MKTRLIIWLSIELIVASGISAVSCILRHDEVEAYNAWHDNPMFVTKAELDKQKNITFWEHVGFAGVLFFVMAVITIPAVYVVSRREQMKQV
jgi:hypothetical protein